MSLYVDVPVTAGDPDIPQGMIDAVRAVMPEAMAPAMRYLWQHTPVVSGTLRASWRLLRTKTGVALANVARYARFVRHGRFQRFAFAIIINHLRYRAQPVIQGAVHEWFDTPEGRDWVIDYFFRGGDLNAIPIPTVITITIR